jgi:hypothetical protein
MNFIFLTDINGTISAGNSKLINAKSNNFRPNRNIILFGHLSKGINNGNWRIPAQILELKKRNIKAIIKIADGGGPKPSLKLIKNCIIGPGGSVPQRKLQNPILAHLTNQQKLFLLISFNPRGISQIPKR